MRRLPPVLAAVAVLAGPALADRPGDFDYWVLALSWSPTWCLAEGDAGDAQCAEGRRFVLHGLWPQHEDGYPSYCRATYRDPTRRETADQADLFGSAGLAWHAWDKHGTCSGLSPRGYYDLAREAVAAVAIPPGLAALAEPRDVATQDLERAFTLANPGLGRDAVTVTCDDGRLDEIRVCLDLDLRPRPCGEDVARDCRQRVLEVPAP